MEIGKELAVCHAPSLKSVDVQCSIALLFIYSYVIQHNASSIIFRQQLRQCLGLDGLAVQVLDPLVLLPVEQQCKTLPISLKVAHNVRWVSLQMRGRVEHLQ